MDEFFLSIIIVTWNSREEIPKCLESLRQTMQDSGFRMETFVFDNHSSDGTAEWLRAHAADFKTLGLEVLYSNANLGLSTATQDVYSMTKGGWILLCNPDIIFTKDFRKMLEYVREYPSTLMITAELINDDGSKQRVVHRRLPTMTCIFLEFSYTGANVRRFLTTSVHDWYCYTNDRFVPPVSSIEQPGASFLLLKRTAIEKLGGKILSTEFPVWWNDVDLAKRAEEINIPRFIMPDVHILHKVGYSPKSLPDEKFLALFFGRPGLSGYAKKWRMHSRILALLLLIDELFMLPIRSLLYVRSSQKKLNGLSRRIRVAAIKARCLLSV